MRATPRPGASLRELLPEDTAAAAAHRPRRTAMARMSGRCWWSEKLVKEYHARQHALGKLFGRSPPPSLRPSAPWMGSASASTAARA